MLATIGLLKASVYKPASILLLNNSMLIQGLTHVPIIINSTTDKTSRGVCVGGGQKILLQYSNRGRGYNCLQLLATSESDLCLSTAYKGWESSLVSFRSSPLVPSLKHTSTDRQGTLMWFCWLHSRPCQSFGRHHAWQFRKAGRSSMQCQNRNEELLSFGSDPSPPPGTDSKAKLKLYVEVNIHHTHRCNLYIYGLYCSKWGG